MNQCGLYVHVPFCIHKCRYCDFASGIFDNLDHERYLTALDLELSRSQELNDGAVITTVFVGGGTPSLLSHSSLERLLRTIRNHLPNPSTIEEWTVEANPNSLNPDKLKVLIDGGVTRVSIGVQSLQKNELTFLERQHDAKTALTAMGWAEDFFPGSWSCDLIYGIPGMTKLSWGSTLEQVVELNPPHISAYELTVEETTSLGLAVREGRVQPQKDKEILARQTEAIEILGRSQLQRYEISNWSRDGHHCRHNDNIWTGADYLGFGNGAHSRVGDCRWRNTASPMDYVERLETGRTTILESLMDKSDQEQLETVLLLGLRRRAGIPTVTFMDRFGKKPLDLWANPSPSWRDFVKINDNQLALTERGWCVMDRLVLELSEAADLSRQNLPEGGR